MCIDVSRMVKHATWNPDDRCKSLRRNGDEILTEESKLVNVRFLSNNSIDIYGKWKKKKSLRIFYVIQNFIYIYIY